jgi:hypothetical protein
MADSPRERMKRQQTERQRPAAEQNAQPNATPSGLRASPGSLTSGWAAMVFFAYVFNFGGLQTWMDSLLSGLDTNVRSHNNEVVRWFVEALPFFGMVLMAMILFLILSKLSGGSGRNSSARAGGKHPKRTTLDEFVHAAAGHGVSERVAREAYSLLAPRYGRASIGLADSFDTRLAMTPAQIADMQGTLMRYTDRQTTPGGRGAEVQTVLDLILTVERSTVRSVAPAIAPVAPTRALPAMLPSKTQTLQAVAPNLAALPAATFLRPYRPEKKQPQGVAFTATERPASSLTRQA